MIIEEVEKFVQDVKIFSVFLIIVLYLDVIVNVYMSQKFFFVKDDVRMIFFLVWL